MVLRGAGGNRISVGSLNFRRKRLEVILCHRFTEEVSSLYGTF